MVLNYIHIYEIMSNYKDFAVYYLHLIPMAHDYQFTNLSLWPKKFNFTKIMVFTKYSYLFGYLHVYTIFFYGTNYFNNTTLCFYLILMSSYQKYIIFGSVRCWLLATKSCFVDKCAVLKNRSFCLKNIYVPLKKNAEVDRFHAKLEIR